MALIKISNLNPAGSDLFAGEESFLTELKEVDSDRIFGGGSNGKKKKKNSKNSGGFPPIVIIPVPYFPAPCCPAPAPGSCPPPVHP